MYSSGVAYWSCGALGVVALAPRTVVEAKVVTLVDVAGAATGEVVVARTICDEVAVRVAPATVVGVVFIGLPNSCTTKVVGRP